MFHFRSIRREVLAFRPKNISQAIGLTRLQEEKIAESRTPNRPPYKLWDSLKPTSNTTSSVSLLPTPKMHQLPKKPEPRSVPIRKLTAAQMHERRDKGLYFNYDEKFHPIHRCKSKLFLLVLDDEIERAGTDTIAEPSPLKDTPAISFHALVGQMTSNTFRLLGVLHGQIVQVLINRGSTHNFI